MFTLSLTSSTLQYTSTLFNLFNKPPILSISSSNPLLPQLLQSLLFPSQPSRWKMLLCISAKLSCSWASTSYKGQATPPTKAIAPASTQRKIRQNRRISIRAKGKIQGVVVLQHSAFNSLPPIQQAFSRNRVRSPFASPPSKASRKSSSNSPVFFFLFFPPDFREKTFWRLAQRWLVVPVRNNQRTKQQGSAKPESRENADPLPVDAARFSVTISPSTSTIFFFYFRNSPKSHGNFLTSMHVIKKVHGCSPEPLLSPEMSHILSRSQVLADIPHWAFCCHGCCLS